MLDGITAGQAIGFGVPGSIIMAILGWLTKSYFENRKDKREDTKTERESESGIVETTGATLQIVRGEITYLAAQLIALRTENEQQAKLIKKQAEKIETCASTERQLNARLSALEAENATLRLGTGS
jgi:hypothetical protein